METLLRPLAAGLDLSYENTGGTLDITVTAEKPENGKVVATLTIPAAVVDGYVKNTYRDIARRYSFQGFRKGRAPRPVIDGIVGRAAVLAQATEDLLNDASPEMIEELDVVAIEQPDFGEDPVSVTEHEDFTATVTISVPPTAELDSYDAPAIHMPPETATEAEIDQQVEQLMSYQETEEPIDEDRPVAEDDVITATVEAVSEDEPRFVGEDRRLNLGGTYIPAGLSAGIVGMNKGETRNVSWTESHGDHEHNYEVAVTVKDILKSSVPELTDEFAKEKMGFDTVEELRAAVKEEIENDKKHSLPTLKEDRVVEAIGEHLVLDEIPDAYEEQVFNELAQEVLSQLQRQNITLDLFLAARGITADEFVADLHSQAAERARQSLALDAVAAHLGLDASEDDVRKEFENAGVEDVDKSIAQFRSEGQLPALRTSIRRRKAVEWLAEHAPVEIVDEIAEARAKAAAEPEDEAQAEPQADDAQDGASEGADE